jgi:hypothetical protein
MALPLFNEQRVREFREFIAMLPEDACNMTYVDNAKLFNMGTDLDDARRGLKKGFDCGAAGCLIGWGRVFEQLKTRRCTEAEEFFGFNSWEHPSSEGHKLFINLCYTYPNEVPEIGWKQFMLNRLDYMLKHGDLPSANSPELPY